MILLPSGYGGGPGPAVAVGHGCPSPFCFGWTTVCATY